MQRLYVIYDATCELCRRCRVWLARQPAFVPLIFVPLQSPELSRRFPGIERLHPEEEIVVINELGDVWQGGAAWVMCLWALREYREWSQRLAHPALLPLARRVCELVSENRQFLSCWLFNSDETAETLREKLSALPAGVCANEGYCKPR
jgi:predicted DCC family thiol-disulfide oxidoreductase YuxK